MRRLVKRPAKRLDEEKTSRLLDMVQRAFAQHEQFYKEANENKRKIDRSEMPGDAQVVVNFQSSFVRTTAPTLFFREPKLKALPVAPHLSGSAKTWDAVLEAAVERTGYKEQTKKCILDALYYAEGWKKFVATRSVSTEEFTGEEPIGDTNPGAFRETENDQQGVTTWDNIDAPVGYRISPLDIATDCPNRTIEGSRFIVVRYRRFLNELIEDPAYPKIDKAFRDKVHSAKLDTANRLGVDYRNPTDKRGPKDTPEDDEVFVYEVWVHQLVELNLYRQLVVLVEGFSEAPVRPIESWSELVGEYVTGYPFTKLTLLASPDSRPLSVLSSWASLQKALNVVVSRIVQMTDRLGLKYQVNRQSLQKPDEAISALRSNKPVEVIELTGPDPGVAVVDNSRIPADLFVVVQTLMSLQTQVSGLSQNQRGGAGVRTATEASIIDQNTSIRQDEMVDRVADFIKQDAEVIVKMLRHALSPNFVFRLVGDVGGIKWQNFTAEDIAWSPDVRVEPHSFRKADLDTEAQKYLQVLSVGSQLSQLFPIRLDTVFSQFLKRLEIPEASEIVSEAIDSEKKQLEEILLMAFGVDAPVLPTDVHQVEVQIIDSVLNSGLDIPPDLASRLMAHREQHVELASQAGTPTINITGGQDTFGNAAAMSGVAQGTRAPSLAETSIGSAQMGGGGY